VPIGTKISTGIHLDTRNNPVKAFLKFRKIHFPGEVKGKNLNRNWRFSNSTVREIDPRRLRVTKIYTGTHIDTR